MSYIKQFLDAAGGLIDERGADYGGVEDNFANTAQIANAILGRDLTPYDVAVVLAAVKLARMRVSPHKLDSYLDCVNYVAFAAAMRPDLLAEVENR